MKKSSTILLLCSSAMILASGCAQKVTVKALEPAEVERAAITKRIAVSGFKNDSVGLSQKVESEIAAKQLDGKAYFTTVSRSDIDKVVKEQRFQYSGLLNEEAAVELGKLVGAEALISGVISSTSSSDTGYSEKRSECADKKCKEMREYTVSCTKRTISLGAQIKMVDIAKGDIIYGNTIQENDYWTHCSDDRNALPSKSQGLDSLANTIAQKFVFKLAPHYIYYEVALLDKPDIDYSDRQEQELTSALEFIEHKRYDRSEKLLSGLMESTSNRSYVAAYNLGVVKEAQGQFEEAKTLYALADELTLKPVEEINDAINRIDQAILKRKRALAQMAR
jgi:hypothetical protein